MELSIADRGRLLVLGGSPLQAPAIVKAQELGFHVAVADRNPGVIGALTADRFFQVSATDIEGVLCIAREFGPDGILTLGTDMPMRAVAEVAAVLGLPGPSPESIALSTDKGGMATAFNRANVPAPQSVTGSTAEGVLRQGVDWKVPVIMKPVDNSGSRGVILVEHFAEWSTAFHYAQTYSPSGCVIVQEYLRGREVSVEGFCLGSETHVVAVTDKTTTGPPHFVELGHSQPSQLSPPLLEEIAAVTAKAAAALGVSDCAIHAELMVTNVGPVMIEFGARLGGDYITTELVPRSTGVDMVKALIQLSCGAHPDLTQLHDRGSAIRFFSSIDFSQADIGQAVDGMRMLPGVAAAECTGQCGARVLRNSTDRLGHVIVEAASAQEAVGLADSALGFLRECPPDDLIKSRIIRTSRREENDG